MIDRETDKIIDKLFKSLLQNYDDALQKKSKEVTMLFKLHKTSPNRSGSYIDSPEWLINIKVTINPINKNDDKCSQYAITAALNYQNINRYPQRILENKPFINQYDWNGIEFPSLQKDWKKFENKTIALNVLFIPYNTKQIRPAYMPEYNLNRKNK